MFVFRDKIYIEEIDSTNSYLKSLNAVDGTLLYTFNQTKGRGRENREWLNFKDKDLALSVLFVPQYPVENFLWHIAVFSLSLIDMLKEEGVENGWIKWPNDVYVGDGKIAGVLAESVWNGGVMEKLIVGIGININSDRDDLSAIDKKTTSVYIETNKFLSLNSFAERYVEKLERYFGVFFSDGGKKEIRKRWIDNNKLLGKRVEWIVCDKKYIGTIVDIDDDGYPTLDDGVETRRVISGDIFLI
ncbi:MAG TPA: biotin--[acetyl-CoA-carboxylase] ligase [Spirochaetota bacterium]|jgi:BirA family biotin operon repressor/biotin-[acetyl-CoA-carboxylase] ligase|nr:MAG: Bifunctional ligase/repressor BirA [Spirochaetes bacterium ADurb.Bin133]HNZ26404.1 biotin--[acetyl-CoA-carboxylase] ligase [Spirochaetota bacterium]HPY87034.1 biotin--[acetyl-CoA-carboxylase] ligase [Spirochaetota bacterium]HQB61755.1 biotin--[acetyl-CoA-carboxylase] ligase [Spirochaetota bacterium]